MSGIQRTLIAGNADKIAQNFAERIAANYQAAIIAAGGSISATQLTAVKAFVKTGFKDRWWFSIVDCCLFLGADLTSSLVKIVAAPGAGTSYVSHNLVSGDYGATTGITVSGNTTKYIGSGVIPADQGLGANNLLLVTGSVGPVNAQATWGCDEADGGNIACISGLLYAASGNRTQNVSWGISYNCAVTYMPAHEIGVLDGIRTFDQLSNGSDGTFSTEIEMFRTTKFGTKYIANTANIGFFAVGKMVTESQLRSMSAAVLRLHRAARAIATPTRYVFLGDSITFGQGVTNAQEYATLVAAARSAEATNIAISGTEMISDGNGLAGRHRYRGTETFPIHTFFCMLGTNDLVIEDATTNGDAAVIASQQHRVVILSVSYTTRANQTKVLAWVDGALAAASDAGVIGIDTCRPMIDTGNPGQFLGDTVHLNDVGHAFVRDLILAVI